MEPTSGRRRSAPACVHAAPSRTAPAARTCSAPTAAPAPAASCGASPMTPRAAGDLPAPARRSCEYGKSVAVAGYATLADGLPASGAARHRQRDGRRRGQSTTVTTRGDGFYSASLEAQGERDLDGERRRHVTSDARRRSRSRRRSRWRSRTSTAGRTAQRDLQRRRSRPTHAGSQVVIQKADRLRAGGPSPPAGSTAARASARCGRCRQDRDVQAAAPCCPAHADHAEGTSLDGGPRASSSRRAEPPLPGLAGDDERRGGGPSGPPPRARSCC